MHRHLMAALAAVALLLPNLLAQQQVILKGTIDALTAAGCDPLATHRIRCTDVLLKSGDVDLIALQGRVVDLTGNLELQGTCITLDVTTAVAATARTSQLAVFGTRLGRSVVFTSITPPGSTVFYLWSCGPGFLPLGPVGTLLMDLNETILVGSNLSIGFDVRTETIPNNPNLIGVHLQYQFGYLSLLTGFEVGFLNPGCIDIIQ